MAFAVAAELQVVVAVPQYSSAGTDLQAGLVLARQDSRQAVHTQAAARMQQVVARTLPVAVHIVVVHSPAVLALEGEVDLVRQEHLRRTHTCSHMLVCTRGCACIEAYA